MTAEEIRESGLLELYVLGSLSDREVEQVEGYLLQYPELQKDYLDLQQTMQSYAEHQGITPPKHLKSKVLLSIRDEKNGSKTDSGNTGSTSTSKSSKFSSWWLPAILSLLTMGALWFSFQKSNNYNELQDRFSTYKIQCDKDTEQLAERLKVYEAINSQSSKTIQLTPTEGFPQTNLLFHLNDETKQNYLQVKNLPAIATGEAFQLWSLKEGQDPIPLTVFRGGENFILPVDYEPGTATYAITIEKAGGSQTPNLDKLIGTASVA